MLKKLFGGLFTIILLLLITTLSLVLVVRNVTSKDTINDMLNIFATNNNETINTDDITVEENMSETNIVDTILNEVLDETSIPNEVIDYIESDEVSNYLNEYITQYFQYTIGMAEMPVFNSPELNELINTGIEEYENTTGNEVDKEEIDNIITTIDETVSEIEIPSNKYIDTAKQILRVCFDNRTIYIMIGLIIVINIIIAILVGIRSMFKRLSIILVIDGLLLFGASLALTFLSYNEIVNSMLKITIKSINTLAYTIFGIGVSIYILLIFINPKKTVKENVVEEIETKEEPKEEKKKRTKTKKDQEKK
ncbi:MAG: hypothetical protein ACI4OP_08430 [Candidatus Coprovivens sp.]